MLGMLRLLSGIRSVSDQIELEFHIRDLFLT